MRRRDLLAALLLAATGCRGAPPRPGSPSAPFNRALFTATPRMSLRSLWSLFSEEYPHGERLPPAGTPRQIRQRLNALEGRDHLLWLGHAACLLRLADTTLLTDPFLSSHAGPIPRATPSPLTVEQLPPTDVIVVSHNRYDHLDRESLRRLAERDPATVVVTAAGNGDAIRESGFPVVVERGWGEETAVKGLRIKALPALHFSGRGLFDRNDALWASFLIADDQQRRVLFMGDSGYSPALSSALAREGPYSLALMPIGGYAPRSEMRDAHMTPEEALLLAREIGARRVVAIHWGTLRLSLEPIREPAARLVAASGDPSMCLEIGAVTPLDQEPHRRYPAP